MKTFCFFIFILFSLNSFADLQFHSSIQSIPFSIQRKMIDNSWHYGCPVPINDLAYLTVSYWGFDRATHQGVLIVNKRVANQVVGIFHKLFQQRFVIEKIRPMYLYGGDDNQSMADNNTSGFDCRNMTGQNVMSKHSYGLAIDINPLINPYIHKGNILPPQGKNYLNRQTNAKGMIVQNDGVVRAFTRRGWQWGGDWKYAKDYGHLEKRF